jgi:arsenical pump membrane protein
MQLGLPTAVAGALTAGIVLIAERKPPWPMLKHISWGVLPLVAGLFMLVEALNRTGLIPALSALLQDYASRAEGPTAWVAGITIAFVSNLINNLPAGLVAGTAVQSAHVSGKITSAVLIGVDLGPNLSVTGSLATILWLTALRREGQKVSAMTFLKLGFVIMPPALLLALAGRLCLP